MSEQDIGGDTKKNVKSRSYSSGFTVWASEQEWHKWKRARDELGALTSESNSLNLYRSSFVGFNVRAMAARLDISFEETIAIIQRAMTETANSKQEIINSDSVNNVLLAQAVEDERLYQEQKERDDKLIGVLERKGLNTFIEWVKEIDENFEWLSWLRRVGLAYELPWKEKTFRLLLAYFAQYGEQPRDTVIQWCRETDIIDNEQGGTIGSLTKLATEFGFSAAGKHGYWALPDVLRKEVPRVDITKFDGTQKFISLFTDDTGILVENK